MYSNVKMKVYKVVQMQYDYMNGGQFRPDISLLAIFGILGHFPPYIFWCKHSPPPHIKIVFKTCILIITIHFAKTHWNFSTVLLLLLLLYIGHRFFKNKLLLGLISNKIAFLQQYSIYYINIKKYLLYLCYIITTVYYYYYLFYSYIYDGNL